MFTTPRQVVRGDFITFNTRVGTRLTSTPVSPPILSDIGTEHLGCQVTLSAVMGVSVRPLSPFTTLPFPSDSRLSGDEHPLPTSPFRRHFFYPLVSRSVPHVVHVSRTPHSRPSEVPRSSSPLTHNLARLVTPTSRPPRFRLPGTVGGIPGTCTRYP